MLPSAKEHGSYRDTGQFTCWQRDYNPVEEGRYVLELTDNYWYCSFGHMCCGSDGDLKIIVAPIMVSQSRDEVSVSHKRLRRDEKVVSPELV